MTSTELYLQLYPDTTPTATQIAGAGSNRTYSRLTAPDGPTLIATQGEDVEENRAFIALSRHFVHQGLPVPEVLAVSPDGRLYLQTDCGDRSLFQQIKAGRDAGGHYTPSDEALLERTIRLLPHMQVEGAKGLDWNECLAPRQMDADAALFDLHYFQFCFLRPNDVPYCEPALEADFQSLARLTTETGLQGFLYRDFQARNVMLSGSETEPEIRLIDFQDGRRGPITYDVACFLYQASALYSPALRERLLSAYLSELRTLLPAVDEGRFRQEFRLMVLLRLLQVLGAYGLRGLYERKPHFLRSIPHALRSVQKLLQDGVCAPWPELEKTLQALAQKVLTPAARPTQRPELVVDVVSFSYKRGIPLDESGNGGGYVFDCRCTNNPGRYPQYQHLTGLDQPVRDFIENDGELLRYLDGVQRLIDAHVRRYVERHFTHLQICFGCTGGQHRSVYCADFIARHLHRQFGLHVRLTHREQGITQEF